MLFHNAPEYVRLCSWWSLLCSLSLQKNYLIFNRSCSHNCEKKFSACYTVTLTNIRCSQLVLEWVVFNLSISETTDWEELELLLSESTLVSLSEHLDRRRRCCWWPLFWSKCLLVLFPDSSLGTRLRAHHQLCPYFYRLFPHYAHSVKLPIMPETMPA